VNLISNVRSPVGAAYDRAGSIIHIISELKMVRDHRPRLQ